MMLETLTALKRKRTQILAANLGYFLVLLALSFFLFFRSRSIAVYVAGLAALAVYLLLIRPMTGNYKKALRGAILRYGVCDGMTDFSYAPREGFKASDLITSGMVNTVSDKAFLSREKVTARRGALQLEMADVTFPIRERGLNAMSSGLFIRIFHPGASFPELMIRAGQLDDLPLEGKALSLLKEMASFVPGNLYLNTAGDVLYVFFRGRFAGFKLNPLLELTENTLRANPLPEADQSLRLAKILAQTERA